MRRGMANGGLSPTPPEASPVQSTRHQVCAKSRSSQVYVATRVLQAQGTVPQAVLGFAGLTAVAASPEGLLMVVHDGMVDLCVSKEHRLHNKMAASMKGLLEQSLLGADDYLQATQEQPSSNPYAELDAGPTHCGRCVVVERVRSQSGIVARATTAHSHERTQGTVVGNFFSEGVHVWSIEVADLAQVAIGVVSLVGLDDLAREDGSPPAFICSLRQSPLQDFRIYSKKDGDVLEESKAISCLTGCDTQSLHNVQVKVCASFSTGVVSFLLQDKLLGSVHLGPLLGDHSVAVHLKSGTEVTASYQPTAPARQLSCISDLYVGPSPLVGNPYIRWCSIDGLAPTSTGFVQPLGSLLTYVLGTPVCIVTDRHLLRVIDLETRRMQTVHLAVQGLPSCCHRDGDESFEYTPDMFLCGICEAPKHAPRSRSFSGSISIGRKLSSLGCLQASSFLVTDVWNQVVLEVTPAGDEQTVGIPAARRGESRADSRSGTPSVCDWDDEDPSNADSASFLSPISDTRLNSPCSSAGTLSPLLSSGSVNAAGTRRRPRRRDRGKRGLRCAPVWTARVLQKRTFAIAAVPLKEVRQKVLRAWSGSVVSGVYGSDPQLMAAFSGSCGEPGGTNALQIGPWGACTVGSWIFVTDSKRHCIFAWNSDNTGQEAVVVAGCPGSPGDKEGWGTQGRLRCPTDIVADEDAVCLYAADTGNHRVVKILLRFYADRYEGCITPLQMVLEGSGEPIHLHQPISVALGFIGTSKYLTVGEQVSRRVFQASIISSATTRKSAPVFTAPLEKILDLLKGLRKKEQGEAIYIIDEVTDLLVRQRSIYSATMPKSDMDEELADWLKAGYFEEPPTASPLTVSSDMKWRRPSTKDMHSSVIEAIVEGREFERVSLPLFESFHFDLVACLPICNENGGPLFQCLLNVFHYYKFHETFPINAQKLLSFGRVVEIGYQHVPYHNSTHAADVLQTLHSFVVASRLRSKFSDLELLAMYTAAAVHDYDHPGVNNQFLIQTRDALSVRYNDTAVLENYHVAQVYEMLGKYAEIDWLQAFSPSEQATIREIMISLIINTDMKQHFTLLSQFKARQQSYDMKKEWSEDDKRLLMKILLHAADISNPTKPHHLSIEWTNRIMSEFRQQGQSELDNDLPYSPFCEPETDVPKCQRGFIEFVVRPQFQALRATFPVFAPLLKNLEVNYCHWNTKG